MPNFATRAPHVELIAEMIQEALVNINTVAVGKVHAVEASGRVSVQLLHKGLYSERGADGRPLPLDIPPVTNVPVAYFGAPNFKLFRKPATGDYGILLTSQRSIDSFKASLAASPETLGAQPTPPADRRMFDINDGIFFPCYFGGQGPDGFSGVVSKAPFGDAKVGFKSGGKISVEGAGPPGLKTDLSSILNDMQSQIDRTNDALVGVATAGGPITAAGVPFAITSKVKNKIAAISTNIKKTYGFSDPSSLFSLGLKILKVLSDGSLQKEPEATPNTEDPPGFQVIVQPRQLYYERVTQRTIYGFIVPGVNERSGNRYDDFDGQDSHGQGDFSIFSNVKDGAGWADCVGAYIHRLHSENRYYLVFVWTKPQYDLSRVRYVRIRLKEVTDPRYDPTEHFVGGTELPARANPVPLQDPRDGTKTLSTLWGTWGEIGSSYTPGGGPISKIFDNAEGFWSALWGAWTPKEPVWYLAFYDENDSRINIQSPKDQAEE